MRCLISFILVTTLLTPLLAEERPLRTKDSYHPFREVDSRDAWDSRAATLRRQILVATGLWPMPTKHPLNADIYGLVERDDYTVEKVTFESFPGHYVSGSLYRPKNLKRGQQVPGILSPHGHWTNGRFHDHGETEFAKQIASGGEVFPSGRHPLQARCVQLARMGCVVFHYDMVGYADSIQLDHRSSALKDGLYSVSAELRQQNLMGIQTFNSIRALDFLEALPGIDGDRLGVTGASGGGSQTFMLGAVDERPDLLFPAVMVSTGMQGGCVCENANYLRVGAGNIDLAALAAPRPLGITGADDWTIEIETKGKPELDRLYTMLGVPENFEVFPYLKFKHNYNTVSREAMYGFVNKHFQLGYETPIKERAFTPLTKAEMSVWTKSHPAPVDRGAPHEAALLNWWAKDSDLQLATLQARMTNDEGATKAYREIVGGAWEAMIGRSWEDVGEVTCEMLEKESGDTHVIMNGKLTATAYDEQVDVTFLHPRQDWNGEVIVRWSLPGEDEVDRLIKQGYSIVSVVDDVTKATLSDGKVSGFTYGYNPTIFARRVQNMLTVIQGVVQHPDWDVHRVHLIGEGRGSSIVLATRLVCQDASALGRTLIACMSSMPPIQPSQEQALSIGQVEKALGFDQVTDLTDPWFVPGSVKYGGIEALIRLNGTHYVCHVMPSQIDRGLNWLTLP